MSDFAMCSDDHDSSDYEIYGTNTDIEVRYVSCCYTLFTKCLSCKNQNFCGLVTMREIDYKCPRYENKFEDIATKEKT